MPYQLKKFKTGYKVQNKETKKYYSKSPIPYKNAVKQMRLLYMIGYGIQNILNMPHSAYKSMRLSQLGLSKPTTKRNKGALKKWKDEEWLNLNALMRGIISPCGKKVKEQGNEPTVCRPRYDKSDKTHKTPHPLAESLTNAQIKKAIKQKQQGLRINWSNI